MGVGVMDSQNMDIYEVNVTEGIYLVSELEKIRRTRDRGRLFVRCNDRGNDEVYKAKKIYLLDNNLLNLFSKAQEYFLILNNNNMEVILVYSEYNIVYQLYEKNNWKVVEVEIIEKDLCPKLTKNQQRIINRPETTALLVLVTYAYKYGLNRVCNIDSPLFLNVLIHEIAKENISDASFDLESKISVLLSSKGFSEEFVNSYYKKQH